jgi:hypothetical protein
MLDDVSSVSRACRDSLGRVGRGCAAASVSLPHTLGVPRSRCANTPSKVLVQIPLEKSYVRVDGLRRLCPSDFAHAASSQVREPDSVDRAYTPRLPHLLGSERTSVRVISNLNCKYPNAAGLRKPQRLDDLGNCRC